MVTPSRPNRTRGLTFMDDAAIATATLNGEAASPPVVADDASGPGGKGGV